MEGKSGENSKSVKRKRMRNEILGDELLLEFVKLPVNDKYCVIISIRKIKQRLHIAYAHYLICLSVVTISSRETRSIFGLKNMLQK